MQFAERVLAILDWILEDTALMLCKDTQGSASTCDSSLSQRRIPLRTPSAFSNRSMKSSFSSNWRL